QLINPSGSVTDSYLYDSWGNVLLVSGTTANSFRYVGRMGYYYDADLTAYLLRMRFYNSQRGSFSAAIRLPQLCTPISTWPARRIVCCSRTITVCVIQLTGLTRPGSIGLTAWFSA